MALLYKMDHCGGFVVGDTDTGATAYAYPTSPHATKARTAPALVAVKMQASANKYGTHMTRHNEAMFHRHQWLKLLAIPTP